MLKLCPKYLAMILTYCLVIASGITPNTSTTQTGGDASRGVFSEEEEAEDGSDHDGDGVEVQSTEETTNGTLNKWARNATDTLYLLRQTDSKLIE